MRRLLAILLTAGLLAAGCGDDDDSASGGDVTIRLVSHDSFAASEEVLAKFTADTGIKVKIVESGDAGAALNQAILSKGNPIGDVFFGVDNTFLGRAFDADLFDVYKPAALDRVDDKFKLDDRGRVTPIDHGEVCVNYDKAAFATANSAPKSLDDLAASRLKSKLVVENPATSSPGLAFLLATIAKYGDGKWQDYWRKLRANDVQVVAGWEEAYNQAFSGSAGKGPRPLVVSYASSPAAEVVFAEPPRTDAPTGVVTESCFEQIEFAGILKGTKHRDEARQLVDFMLGSAFQEDIPLQMFVYPVVTGTKLPDVYTKHAAVVEDPLRLDADEIGRNRDRWIEEWTSIVLR